MAAARTWLNRFIHPFRPSPPEGRQLQLLLDAATVYTVIPTNPPKFIHQPDSHQSYVSQLLNLPALPPLEHQAAAVRTHLHVRVATILNATRHAILSPSQFEPAVRQSLGFCPVIQQSSVPSAGRGVHIQGAAKPGDIIALYPGMSFLPSQFRNAAIIPSDYAISRFDGVTIDGAHDVVLDLSDVLPPNHVHIPEKRLVHPFAQGHLINHPPPGVQPNALQFMIDLDSAALPSAIRQLVPVENSSLQVSYLERLENLAVRQRVPAADHFVSRVLGERVKRTIVIIALTHIVDEEVFINYRFNPAVEAPEWYVDCDPASSQRRWKRSDMMS